MHPKTFCRGTDSFQSSGASHSCFGIGAHGAGKHGLRRKQLIWRWALVQRTESMGRTAADLELVIGLPRTIPAGAGKPTPPLTACGQRRPLAAELLSRKSYEVGSLSSRLCHKVSCAMGGGGPLLFTRFANKGRVVSLELYGLEQKLYGVHYKFR